MASREIRYVGVSWQVTSLPDNSKELIFADPDGVTYHILPLSHSVAEALAAQLQGQAKPAPLQSNYPDDNDPTPIS